MQNKEIGGEKSVNEKNVEVFNRYFPGCLSIENDNQLTLDVGRLKALLGDFSEIKEEGYGLDFVGKKIALNQAFKKNHKILKPLNKSTSKHILIKGDNLDALKILKQSYSEKIKMIYIDPPYNTKNDSFIYGDDFSQSNEEVLKTLDYSKEKLDYIKNLFGSKCHSGWLSFMYPRLLLAKDLLKQDGVIFISIDDNEAAQLKLLCDEIFGDGNFVANLVWKSKSGGANDSKNIITDQEYILCYAKNITNLNFDSVEYNEENLKLYNCQDEFFDKRGPYRKMLLMQKGLSFSSSLTYEITAPDGTTLKPDSKSKAIWRWSENKFKQGVKNHFIEFEKDKKGQWKIYTKQYLNMDYDGNRIERKSNLRSIVDNVDGRLGTRELQRLFDNLKIFSYPKPTKLISRLIELSTNEGDTILDFFAGSGTTAHAVLESNKSDYQKLSEGGG
ncbi:type III restriction eodnuclease, partial [Helicobacter pylori PZ5080]